MRAHPPRPRFTLRVGITGHRWDKLDRRNAGALSTQLGSVLRAIQEIAARIHADPEAGFRGRFTRPDEPPPQPPELRLVSALAEGADRLLVDAAPRGFHLQAILPFPVEVYRSDFTEPGSAERLAAYLERARSEAGVLVLDGDRAAPNAFEQASTAICLNSDVVVAVWDGMQGGSGGTGSVVSLASRLGIPVVRVAPDASTDPWLHRADLADHGASAGLAQLAERLAGLCSAPGQRGIRDHDEVPDLREAYFAEKWPTGRRGQLYSSVIKLLGYAWKGWRQLREDWRKAEIPYLRPLSQTTPAVVRANWRERWRVLLGLPESFVEPLLATPLADHYAWASYLANYYAGRYRSSFFWAYTLSWIAVACAAAGLTMYMLGFHEPWSVLGFAGGELLLLILILILVTAARHGSFHERWLAYRSLAERLRSLTYTLPLARSAALRAETYPGDVRSDHWVDWMHRAVIREVGLPPAEMTPAHLEHARRLLVDGELADQVAYHRDNADRLRRAARRLSAGSDVVFFGGVVLSMLHFKDAVLEAVSDKHLFGRVAGIWLGVIGLTTPAFAAAMHGLLSQGEFKETALRSRATERQLRYLIELGRARDAARSSEALGGLAAAAADAMNAELGAWFAAYQAKDVPLP